MDKRLHEILVALFDAIQDSEFHNRSERKVQDDIEHLTATVDAFLEEYKLVYLP